MDNRRPGGSSSAGSRPGGGRPGGGRPGGAGGRGRFMRKRVCRFCKNEGVKIDYKDAKALRPYLTERGRIMPSRITGTCAKHQRAISTAIKRARNIAIIPYTTISMG